MLMHNYFTKAIRHPFHRSLYRSFVVPGAMLTFVIACIGSRIAAKQEHSREFIHRRNF